MNKRMKKDELLVLMNSLKIDKEEFFVVSSGALVLRDIYESAGDLDIVVSSKGLEQLKENYNLVQKESGWYIVNDKVECLCVGNLDDERYGPEKLETGYYVQNIYEYLEYLKTSNREKDIARISLVKDYIEKINNN